MKRSLKDLFREWDSDRFDLNVSGSVPRKEHPSPLPPEHYDVIPELEEKITRRFHSFVPVLTFILGLALSLLLTMTVLDLPAFGSSSSPVLNQVFMRYVHNGMQETGAVNTVAGVILDYRAFDTLGETHVLYTALVAVFVLLYGFEKTDSGARSPGYTIIRNDPVLTTCAKIVIPCAAVYGLYIVCNGHLGPGGGFCGGTVLGAALILSALAFGFDTVERFFNYRTIRVILVIALCFYSLSKGYSFYCGANGIPSGIRPGIPGRIFSAGLILPLNAAVGVVVSCTMYSLYSVFRRGQL